MSGRTPVCVSILQLMGTRLFLSFGLLWIKRLWTFVYKSLYRRFVFIFLGKNLRVELLSCLFIINCRLFYKVFAHFTFPTAVFENSSCFIFSPILGSFIGFNLSRSSGYKVVLFYGLNLHFPDECWCWTSLLLAHYWPLVYFLLWRAYSNLSPFKENWINCLFITES